MQLPDERDALVPSLQSHFSIGALLLNSSGKLIVSDSQVLEMYLNK